VGLAHSDPDDASEQQVSAHVLPAHRPERQSAFVEQALPPSVCIPFDEGVARPIHAGLTQYCPPSPDAKHTVPAGQSIDVQQPCVQNGLLPAAMNSVWPTSIDCAHTPLAQSIELLHVQSTAPPHDASGFTEPSLPPPLLLPLPLPLEPPEPLLELELGPGASRLASPPPVDAPPSRTSGTE
jgi:hypothetical protein